MRISQNLTILFKRYEFWRNQGLSRLALEEKQLRKFRQLIAFAKQRSPYYADIIKARAIDTMTCKPEDFPILTKSDLMANFDQIVTDRRITKRAITDFLGRSNNPMDLFLNEITAVHTSGSSGEAGIFVFSKEDWARGMAQIARNQPFPNPFKRKKIAFYGITNDHYAGISWLSIIRQGTYKRYFDFLPLEISSSLPHVIKRLNAFQPDALNGYVTSTKVLAEKQREGILKISPTEITVGGEVLSDQDKAQLEQTFGCPVINLYSCTEHMWMGNALAGQSSMHLREDDLIFELHKDHTIVSNLFNFTLPLVRYRMTDILTPLKQKTTSGPYIEIDGIIGRIENTPKFINRDGVEDFISHFTINEFFFVPGVKRFQMQLTSKTAFKFMVCLDSSLSPQQNIDVITAVHNRLIEILKQKLMDNVSMEIVVVDDLPVDQKSGKFRLILDATGNEFISLTG